MMVSLTAAVNDGENTQETVDALAEEVLIWRKRKAEERREQLLKEAEKS